jgi:uncharacterized YigZ family protein
MAEPYPIPVGPLRVEYQVVNSRFIAQISRADDAAAARAFIKSIRDSMPEASHHVYAYKIGYGKNTLEGMSDDGEPSGTAGPPALAVIRGAALGDVVLVITRYFGGTKLGTGGLVAAYTQGAQLALGALKTELKIARYAVGVSIAYPLYERLKQLCERYEAIMQGEDFGAEVTCYLALPQSHWAAFQADITELSHGQAAPILLEEA